MLPEFSVDLRELQGRARNVKAFVEKTVLAFIARCCGGNLCLELGLFGYCRDRRIKAGKVTAVGETHCAIGLCNQ